MREQQLNFRALWTIPGQTLSGNTGYPGPPDPVRLRQRQALADLHQVWGAGQPVAGEKRVGILARALGFLDNWW